MGDVEHGGFLPNWLPLNLRLTLAHMFSVPPRTPPRFDAFIDLSPLPKLTTLCLRLKPTYVLPSTIARTIESAASSILIIELTFVGSKDVEEWIPVDGATVALASRCSRLFRVTVSGVIKGEESKMFPKASSTGLLQVRLRISIRIYEW